MRVRLFEKRKDGAYYRETHEPGRGRNQVPLHTRDRDEAERLGKAHLASLLLGSPAKLAGPLTLADLWQRFRVECTAYLDNDPRTRQDEAIRVRILLAHFGTRFDVRRLNEREIADYAVRRRQGGIRLDEKRLTRAVGQSSVHADLSLLRRMLRWAAAQVSGNGSRWLEVNPLEGQRFAREPNPRRAVASIERFNRTRQAIQELIAETGDSADVTRWHRLDLALFLAEATGRRRGAIVGLAWQDFDLQGCTVLWRAEHDKKRREWRTPMPRTFMEEVRRYQRLLQALTGPLFPGVRDASKPMRAELLSQWLTKAEGRAKLPKLDGSLWHAYRRKFATERMQHPTKAVADAGGWRDVGTLLTCYQQTDQATMLAVMSEPRKVTEVAAG
jgi:integrase